MRIFNYNRAKAYSYAKRYALSRNPAYLDFTHLGGDCTNFCSQCLYQGAPQMNYTPNIGWYYISSQDRASAWTGVKYFDAFLTNNIVINNIGDGFGPFGEETDVRTLDVGDFILFSKETNVYFHSAIVVGFKGSMPLIASHSRDFFEQPLTYVDFNTIKCLHVLGYRA